MITCKHVKKHLKQNRSLATKLGGGLEAHVQSCQSCSQEMAIEKMTQALFGSFGEPDLEDSPWDEVRLTTRIKLRIQEMNERGVGSWEIAIISVRSWLVAFGAAAILLLFLSNQLAATSLAPQTETEKISQYNNSLSEELVSNNSSAIGIFDEDSEHGHE